MGNTQEKKPGFASSAVVSSSTSKRFSETPPITSSPPLQPYSNRKKRLKKVNSNSERLQLQKKPKRSYSYQRREPPPQPRHSVQLKRPAPSAIKPSLKPSKSDMHQKLWTEENLAKKEPSNKKSPPLNPFFTKVYERQNQQQIKQQLPKDQAPQPSQVKKRNSLAKNNHNKSSKKNQEKWRNRKAYAKYRDGSNRKNNFHYYAAAKIPLRNQIQKISLLFEYKKQLGTGATSRVLLVESLMRPGEIYAIKELHKLHDINPQMFLRELKILKILTHETIVTFYDVYMDKISYYILMEYCSGGNLLEKIIKEYSNNKGKTKHFTEKRVVIYIEQILRSVQFMHSKNVVHRDLKPNNMVFDREGKHGKLKLIDFGTSSIVSDSKTYPYEQVGTTQFVPPEFSRPRTGADLKKGDMWAMGIMTYLLMCGKMLFSGPSAQEIWRKIYKYEDGRINFERMNVKLSDSCKDFIQKLLRRDPRFRMSAKQALKHEWISNSSEKADNKPLGKHILYGIKAYQESNKLQRILADAILSEMTMDEKKLVLSRIKDRNDVINYLIQYHHSFYHNIDEDEKEMEIVDDLIDDSDYDDEPQPEPEEYYEAEEKQSKPNKCMNNGVVDIIYEDGYERHVNSGRNKHKRVGSKKYAHSIQQSTESVLSTLDSNHEEMLNKRVHQVIHTLSHMQLSLVLDQLQFSASKEDSDDEEGDIQKMTVLQFRNIMRVSQKKYNVEHLITELDPKNSGYIALHKIHQFYQPIDTVRSTNSGGSSHKFSFKQ